MKRSRTVPLAPTQPRHRRHRERCDAPLKREAQTSYSGL